MDYLAPNGRKNTLLKWRSSRRFEAYGLICATPDKMISNLALAKAIGMDPRGLRQVLEHDALFLIELRGDKFRVSPWYRINPAHPPLVMDTMEPPRLRGTIVCGDQIKLSKFSKT